MSVNDARVEATEAPMMVDKQCTTCRKISNKGGLLDAHNNAAITLASSKEMTHKMKQDRFNNAMKRDVKSDVNMFMEKGW